MTQGEAVYKAAARIKKYGVEAFVEMLGEKAIKARGGRARLLKYYTVKYPSALLRIEPKAPYISRTQRSYWKDVKSLSEARDIPINYVHYTDEYHEEEEEAFDECIREAQAKLGGSGWILVKVLKETWIRYYGREQ